MLSQRLFSRLCGFPDVMGWQMRARACYLWCNIAYVVEHLTASKRVSMHLSWYLSDSKTGQYHILGEASDSTACL